MRKRAGLIGDTLDRIIDRLSKVLMNAYTYSRVSPSDLQVLLNYRAQILCACYSSALCACLHWSQGRDIIEPALLASGITQTDD
jgi:hypothetical protein